MMLSYGQEIAEYNINNIFPWYILTSCEVISYIVRNQVLCKTDMSAISLAVDPMFITNLIIGSHFMSSYSYVGLIRVKYNMLSLFYNSIKASSQKGAYCQ